MNVGKIVALIEIIVSVWGALKLVESMGMFRWENKAVKILFYILVIFRIEIGIVNLHWGKFTDLGLLIFSVYLLLVFLCFYQTKVLRTIIVYFLYWLSIMMFQIACLFITAYKHSLILKNYIYDVENMTCSYYGVHIVGMCIEIAVICLFGRFINNKKILMNCSIWFYVGCIVIIVCEVFIDIFLISENIVMKRMDKYPLLFMIVLLWILASMACVLIAVFSYIQEKYKRNNIEMSMKLLSEQYGFVVQSYEEKRRQVHDNMQHDIMLSEMLKNQQYEKSFAYLEDKTKKNERERKNRYTGLTTIDIMLNYKVSIAKDYFIRFDISADIYSCPLKDEDVCVLLGNLLDNSVDAVKKLPKQQRWVEILLKSFNNIFMLEITNPYEGMRRKKQGHYLTTKREDRQMHGIGLGSVEKIVSNYKGDMEITDSNNIFKVEITIF